MSPGRHCRSLGSLLLLLGGSLGVLIRIHQDSVNGTVGQSLLLPVSFSFGGAPRFPLSIIWTFQNPHDKVISCTVLSCSLGAGGVPSNCSTKCLNPNRQHGRAQLCPDNGSLLLGGLGLGDSGVYTVTFRPPLQAWNITLTVQEPPPAPQPPGTEEPNHSLYYVVAGVCSPILLLLLLSCCMWRCARQQKRRIIKQQKISGVEEANMESTALRTMEAIYAQVEDPFQQPQLGPEVVYSSVTCPAP